MTPPAPLLDPTLTLFGLFLETPPPPRCPPGRWTRLEREALFLHRMASTLTDPEPSRWPPARVRAMVRGCARCLDVLASVSADAPAVAAAFALIDRILLALEQAEGPAARDC